MGSKQPASSTSVSMPSPAIMGAESNVLDKAQQIAATPYQAYGGEQIAGVNSQQNTGIAGVNAAANQAAGSINTGLDLTAQGAGAANAQAFSPQALSQYMSPYQQQVVDATMAQIGNQNQQQQQQLKGNVISSGAFGGDRAGVASAQLANQQDLASNATLANLNNQNYTQGLGEFNNQQQTQLAADQANRARQLQAGAQTAQIGTAGQAAALQGAGAQIGAGTLQQTTQQAQDSAAYNQFLQQQAYPFQTTSWLSGIVNGAAPHMGSTTYGEQQQASTGGLGSLLGGGMALAGALIPSDERVKENIHPVGKLFDGQPVYKFNYKGDEKTQIGLMAQNVEKKHPEAVHSLGDLKLVNYDDATKGAAERGKFAYGGVPYASGVAAGSPFQSWVPAPSGGGGGATQYPHAQSSGGGGASASGNNSIMSQIGSAFSNPGFQKGAKSLEGSISNLLNPGSDLTKGGPGYMSDMSNLDTGIPGSDLTSAGPGFMDDMSNLDMGGFTDFGGFASGGVVPRRHYDAGGDVSPFGASGLPDDSVAGQGPSLAVDPRFPFTPSAPDAPAAPVAAMEAKPKFANRATPVASSGVVPANTFVVAHDADGAPVPTDSEGNALNPDGSKTSAGLGEAKIAPTSALSPAVTDAVGVLGGVAPAGGDTWRRMIGQESGGKQFGADGAPLRSPKGAIGIAQVMPGTAPEAAALAGVPFDEWKYKNDPAYNEMIGRAYYKKQLDTFGSPDVAAAAYNAGPGAVSSALAKAKANGGSYLNYLPAETQNYVANVAGGGGSGQALAYSGDGSAPSGGVLGNLGTRVAQLFNPNSATDAPDASSTTGSKSDAGGGLGNFLNLSPEVKQSMIAAGLGIMAAKTNHIGQAIGEGGLAGVDTYAKALDRQIKQKGVDLQQQGLNLASQKQNVEMGATLRSMNASRQMVGLPPLSMSDLIGGGASVPSAVSGSAVAPISSGTVSGVPAVSGGVAAPVASAPKPAPIVTAQQPGTVGSIPANSDFWEGVDPSMNIPLLQRNYQIARASGDSAGAEKIQGDILKVAGMPGVLKNGQMVPVPGAAEIAARAKAMENGMNVDSNGRYSPAPGYAEAGARSKAIAKSAEEEVSNHNTLVPYQPTPGGPVINITKDKALQMANAGQGSAVGPGAGSPPGGILNGYIPKQPETFDKQREAIDADYAKMGQSYITRQNARQRLVELGDILKTFQPGAFAQHKADFVAGLRGVGINVPNTATANPAAFQQFVKDATANVFTDVKDMGGKVMVAEIAGLTKANANPKMQPEADRAILGRGIGLIDWEDKHYSDFANWRKQNPYAYDTSSFETQWMKNNPLNKFVTSAKNEIPALGEQIPDASQRQENKVYMTPKGPARWMVKGWQLEPKN